jgi:catechol 2,3-dioxygenase
MTATARGHWRTSEIGVHSLDHFVLDVPDLGAARTFYGGFGLDVRDEGDDLGLYAFESAHRWARVRRGPRKQLHSLTFGAYADDMPRFAERLATLGVERIDSPTAGDRDALWFRDHDGRAVAIAVAAKCSPDAKVRTTFESCAAGRRGACNRSGAPIVRPRRLSHVLMFTPDVDRAIAFYRDVLGMRLADRSGDGIGFMYAIHGSDHHMIAFAKSNAPGYHHSSWDVPSLEDVGLGGMQMADKGFRHGWGPGRHVLGSNYFWYVQDPWGSFAEFSSDIDYVPCDSTWQGGDHPPQDAFYLWGPEPPSDFVTNYEAR